jgi:penicillin-binding protein 1A
MENMTGGTLPAMTWHDIMQFAHSGVELKPLPGANLQPEQVGPVVQLTSPDGEQAPRRREQLSKKSSEALGSIETLMKSAAGRRVDLNLPHRNFAEAPSRLTDLR